jgi:hypothetical protein
MVGYLITLQRSRKRRAEAARLNEVRLPNFFTSNGILENSPATPSGISVIFFWTRSSPDLACGQHLPPLQAPPLGNDPPPLSSLPKPRSPVIDLIWLPALPLPLFERNWSSGMACHDRLSSPPEGRADTDGRRSG